MRALLLFLLIAPAAAQGSLASSTFSSQCTFVLPSVEESVSTTLETLVVVGGVVSGAMTSSSLENQFTAACVEPDGCLATTCGDCDGDGSLTVLDALLAAQHGVGLLTLTGTDFANCNVDADADVDILDALYLAQAAAGISVSLTCC